MIIVYDSSNSNSSKFFKKRKLLEIISSSLITFAIVTLVFYFWPIVKQEIKYKGVDEQEKRLTFGDLITRMDASEALNSGLDPYFSILIPKIGAFANIIPNVDPNNSEEYLIALKKGVAHARGTNFPSQDKSIYLFSHSTNTPLNFSRYNAVFYLLRKMEKRDKIYIFFMNRKYVYEVVDKKIVDSDDTTWLNDNNQGETLVLQTCDPPGTTLRRLIIVAKRI